RFRTARGLKRRAAPALAAAFDELANEKRARATSLSRGRSLSRRLCGGGAEFLPETPQLAPCGAVGECNKYKRNAEAEGAGVLACLVTADAAHHPDAGQR